MSDESGLSGGNQDEQETMFSCKKCPGVFFREDEKDAHRLKHRNDRKSRSRPVVPGRRKTGTPGPRSSKRGLREPSPTPSTTTLFSVRQVSPPPAQVPDQVTRKRKAKELHEKQSKKQKKAGNTKTPGG